MTSDHQQMNYLTCLCWNLWWPILTARYRIIERSDVMMYCTEPECREICSLQPCISRTSLYPPHGGVYLWWVPCSNMNLSSAHRMRHAVHWFMLLLCCVHAEMCCSLGGTPPNIYAMCMKVEHVNSIVFTRSCLKEKREWYITHLAKRLNKQREVTRRFVGHSMLQVWRWDNHTQM